MVTKFDSLISPFSPMLSASPERAELLRALVYSVVVEVEVALFWGQASFGLGSRHTRT